MDFLFFGTHDRIIMFIIMSENFGGGINSQNDIIYSNTWQKQSFFITDAVK